MKILYIFLFIIMLYSCDGTGEPMDDIVNEYTVKNISEHEVKLLIYYRISLDNISFTDTSIIFFLPTNDKLTKSYINRQVESPFGLLNDSAYVIFDSVRQIIYRDNDGQSRNILETESFSGDKVDDYLYQYFYEITDEDYNNAVPIE